MRGQRSRRATGAILAFVTLAVLGGCAVSPASTGAPTTAPATATASAAPLTASDVGLGDWAFGDPAEATVAAMGRRLGEPDVDTGWETLQRLDGRDGWYADDDPISPTWDHRMFRAVCWQALCGIFGGDTEATATFRGWTLSVWGRWGGGEVDAAEPAVRLTGSGLRLGDTWADFRAAYPHAKPGGGEGASLVIDHPPWPGIFDGVGGWRLDGFWDFERPSYAPDDARITRMSAGEGPEPGCC